MCVNAMYGNVASRVSETLPSDGTYAYGSYPDVHGGCPGIGEELGWRPISGLSRGRWSEPDNERAPPTAKPSRRSVLGHYQASIALTAASAIAPRADVNGTDAQGR